MTDDRERAIRHVHEALRGLETSASGKVRHVALAPDGTAAYIDLRTVGEAWRDAITCACLAVAASRACPFTATLPVV